MPDHVFSLLDDDGLLVVVSGTAFRSVFSARSFDYDFPREIVRGVRERWCVPVPTAGGGGDVRVELSFVPFLSEDGWQLDLAGEGDLIVMPYSQFTFAADGGGTVEGIDGLSYEVRGLGRGTYEVLAESRIARGGACDALSLISLSPAQRHRVNVIEDAWTLAVG
ncbi:MAG: hypothetical protein H6722_35645 [Sandaracinus sp.]|nr:hypothetical protein [Sandaracinus sp.]